MRKLLKTEALPGDCPFVLLSAFLSSGRSSHLLCSISHYFLLFCFLFPVLYPLQVSAFWELWPTVPLCGLSSASWPLFSALAASASAANCVDHCSLNFRALADYLIALICLFTPGHVVNCRPAHRLAATGHLPTFGLTAGRITMRNTHSHPDSPSSRAIIRDGYLRRGVSITGFLFDNFFICFSLSSFVFKCI